MNAMSVSPVKPPINSGGLTVSPTAPTISKAPLPSSNNFTPINLVPETKNVPVNTATVTENSVDLCSKPPTSNGTVSPTPEQKQNEVPTQNHSESNEVENLTTNETKPGPVAETKPEESKNEVKESESAPKENSEPVKEPAQEEPAKEVLKLENNDVKPEVSKEPAKEISKEPEIPTKTEVETKETKSEPEIKQEEVEDVKESKEIKEVKQTEDKPEEQKSAVVESTAKPIKRKAKQPVEQEEEEEEDNSEGRKSKRVRLPTQPYQCPIPELQIIAKLEKPAKASPKPSTEKIIAFYKNEFLAVRNPEGSFYICQTFQNIHRNSTKIKIRWFTNLPQDIFTPDFNDTTEFDCILTNVSMTRVEKDRWKLPEHERTRIENILKRALDVEKGVVDKPSITEEHPDGLDLSLYKDEAQLQKKKKKATSPKVKKETEKPKKTPKPVKVTKAAIGSKKSARLSNLSQTPAKEPEKVKPVEKKDKKKKKQRKAAVISKPSEKPATTKVWEPTVKSSNSSRVVLSLKKENVTKPEVKTGTKRTSNVSTKAASTAPVVPQKRRKEEPKSAAVSQVAASERTGKVRNAGSAVTAKINSAAMRTTKDKERKVSNSSSQRKK